MDNLTKEQRRRSMVANKSRGNLTTEIKFVRFLRQNKVTGWRRHLKNALGKPDFIFKKKKIVVFVDGCYWHGCHLHFKMPSTNQEYWIAKIARNKTRDYQVNNYYKQKGWKVVRIWEHEIKKGDLSVYRDKLKDY